MGILLQIAKDAREGDETWLTPRRLTAYLVLGAVNPALLAAGAEFATSRATEIDRIEAALHAATFRSEIHAQGRAYVIGVMRQDAEAARARVEKGGW